MRTKAVSLSVAHTNIHLSQLLCLYPGHVRALTGGMAAGLYGDTSVW